MRADATVLLACVFILAAGCASTRPEDVPGALPPGKPADIEAAAVGSAQDKPEQLLVLKHADEQPLDIPVTSGAQLIHIWFFPAKSQDGLSWRRGFWLSRVVRTFSWVEEDQMFGSTPIREAMGPDVIDTGAAAEARAMIQVQQTFVDGISRSARAIQAPWSTTSRPGAAPAATPKPAAKSAGK